MFNSAEAGARGQCRLLALSGAVHEQTSIKPSLQHFQFFRVWLS
jgi:hypothetical protein